MSKIEKNTLILYLRMLINMGIGFYSSGLALKSLGVVDFGIFGLVSGLVLLMSFLNTAMTVSTQRFLAFDIGTTNNDSLGQTFKGAMILHRRLAIVVFLLSQAIGLWFVNNYLRIPATRLLAANIGFQFVALSYFITTIQVPFNALLFAREKWGIYAFVSLGESILKLILTISLSIAVYDRLIFYSAGNFLISILLYFLISVICKKLFLETKRVKLSDTDILRKMARFSFWSISGNLAVVLSNQGVLLLVNRFFGITANTALLLANQVGGGLYSFVSNFQMAFNPRIIKLYSQDNMEELCEFLYKTSRVSFLLFYLMASQIVFHTTFYLHIWLHQIPVFVEDILILIIIQMSIDTVSSPLWMISQSSLDIKKYQIIVSIIILFNVIITYIFYYFSCDFILAFYVRIFIAGILLFVRIHLVREMIRFDILTYVMKIILPVFTVISLTFLTHVMCVYLLDHEWMMIAVEMFVALYVTYNFGLTTEERFKIKIELNKLI